MGDVRKFAIGLVGAALLAASILPLSTRVLRVRRGPVARPLSTTASRTRRCSRDVRRRHRDRGGSRARTGHLPRADPLLIPLWARALEQREAQPTLVDRLAVPVVEMVNHDGNAIRLSRGDLVQMVVRAREFDRFVRDFLSRHPESCVVQLGSGLDARFQRVDNGQVRWFDLDLPEVVSLRRQLIPESERNRYLAASVTDPGWMDEVVRAAGPPILFVAEALLMGIPRWFRRVPWLTRATTIRRYVLGSSS